MGKAQSRYLWILLITMIFYGALQERVSVDTDPLKMPIVDVEISGPFVLGFGPALISFFVLAVTGTLRATRPARAKLNLGRGDWRDLAFFPTRGVPKTWRDSDPLQLRYSLGSWSLRGRLDSEAAMGC